MSIIFASIVPHPPLLIPGIGKDNLLQLEATVKSYNKLEQDLYSCQPDTILIISPHGVIHDKTFTINLNPEFSGNFKEFGDFATKVNLSGDIGLTYKIRERMETRTQLQLISQTNLDYGSSIPLFMLTKHLPKVKIIPVCYSGLNLQEHFKFGQLLKRELMVSKNRVAVIASGDLSHRLTKNAPAGYSPKGKKFDKKLMELLSDNNTEEIIKLNEELIASAGECGLKSIVILLGILEGIKRQNQLLSYEFPFGVGYMVMNFKF
jgi:aromatic ring-opening dioxygenase LigB subunit